MHGLDGLASRTIFLVRKPDVKDATTILEYMRRVGAETDFLFLDENGIPGVDIEGEVAYIENVLELINTSMYLGFVGEELVSLCEIRAGIRPRNAHNATIAITVLKQFWNLGIGKTLMQEMVDFARSTNVLENLTLDVRADNTRAVILYERFGFKVVGRYTRYMKIRGEYFDVLLMELRL